MKLSRLAFASKIRVSESTVKNYENGITIPDDDILEQIATLFDTQFIDLWAACHQKEHKRIVEILDKAQKHDYVPEMISDPEMKEICDALHDHPRLKHAVLAMLQHSKSSEGNEENAE